VPREPPGDGPGSAERRDLLLRTIGRVAEGLLAARDWERDIGAALGELGAAAAVDRIYVFECRVDRRGVLRSSQRYEWVADGIAPEIANEELQNVPLREVGFGRWEECLGSGEVIQGHVRDFPASERVLLEAQQIRSLLIVPIFAESGWWGFVGFDECRQEREWSAAEVDALRTAAGILGGAIRHERTATALQESEERYRRLVEQSPEGILVRAGERILFANTAALRMIGWEAGEPVVGRSVLEMVHPGDRPAVRSRIGRNSVHHLADPLEVRLIRADGTTLPAEAIASDVQFCGQDAVQVVLRDITIREKEAQRERALIHEQAARAAAEAAERRARFLAEAGTILASSLDYRTTLRSVARLAIGTLADSCIVYIVESDGNLERLEVAHADPQRERILWELLTRDPPNPGAPASPIARVLRTGEPEIVAEISEDWVREGCDDAELLALCQRVRVASLMALPLVVRGEVLGAISLGTLTPGRQYGAEDLALARELASRAALAIDHARLYHEARQLSRAKSEFMAVMSHELRTPLTAITTYAELLREGVLGPIVETQEQPLDLIHSNAMHLARLIDEVLTYTRTEAGRLEIGRERIEVGALTAELIEWVRPTATAKGISMALNPVRGVAEVETDSTRLRQIVVNLLTNAVRFTEAGTIDVTVETLDDNVWIRVADTGIGIAAEHHAKVFEPFWQVDGSLTRRVGGSGLGLSVVQRLSQLLGGGVSVESELGRGSTFSVWLPTAPPA
jgi:PAS domain S-box-containing protein